MKGVGCLERSTIAESCRRNVAPMPVTVVSPVVVLEFFKMKKYVPNVDNSPSLLTQNSTKKCKNGL
jgi:hypothetical protein